MSTNNLVAHNLYLNELKAEHLIAVLDAEITRGVTSYDVGSAKQLDRHHIDSFDSFLSKGIDQIVTQLFEIDHVFKNDRDKTPEDQNITHIRIHGKFTDVRVDKPVNSQYLSGKQTDLLPNTARKNDLTYSSVVRMNATITATAYHRDETTSVRTEEVKDFMMILPVMLRCRVCHTADMSYEMLKRTEEDPRDPGGYFIIRGGEWAIVMIESRIFNAPHIFRNVGHEREVCRLEFISKPGDAYENSSELITRLLTSGHLHFQFRSSRYLDPLQLPFYVVFRLLGMTTDKEIIDSIVYNTDEIEPSAAHMLQVLKRAMRVKDPAFPEANDMTDHATLLTYICRQAATIMQVKGVGPFANDMPGINGGTSAAMEDHIVYLTKMLPKIMDAMIMPHVGLTADSRHRKARFLGHLLHKMFLVEMQIIPSTDRDSLKGKRIFAAGRAFARAFKTHFNTEVVQKAKKKLVKDLKSMPFSQVALAQSFKTSIKSQDLEKALVQEITSGSDETVSKVKRAATRISSENLHRKNQLNVLSTLRVIRTPNTSASKQDQRSDEMRRVHPSYAGFICIIQSADSGINVGLVKQMALGASLSDATSSQMLKDVLIKHGRAVDSKGVSDINNPAYLIAFDRVFSQNIAKYRYTKVLVNGDWIGCTPNGAAFVKHYREVRRGFTIVPATAVDSTPSRPINAFTYTYKKNLAGSPTLIDPLTTIHWDSDSNEIYFWVDAGRMLRPVLVVRNNGELDPVGRGLIGARTATADGKIDSDLIYDPFKPSAVKFTHMPTGAIVYADDPTLGQYQQHELEPIVEKRGFIQDLALSIEDVKALYSKKISIEILHQRGIIDYIAPEEMENLLIAPSLENLKFNQTNPLLQYTHCEIPAALLGLPAATCPFAAHNQTPRITFQTNQSKQTCGWFALNFHHRVDKHAFLQYYCETPLIHTLANKYMYPNGMNEINAICCYTGFNQEDSLVINYTASQRGLYKGDAFNYTRVILEQHEKIGTPNANNTMDINRHANYDLLINGVVRPGTRIKRDDVIIGKLIELPRAMDNYLYKDASVIYHGAEEAIVDDVIRGRNQDSKEFIKVKYSSARPADVGSKFCLRPTAQILTSDGWIEISKIRMAHKIATLAHYDSTAGQFIDNSATATGSLAKPNDVPTLVYREPLAISAAENGPSGRLYECIDEHVGIHIVCTPEHKLYAKTAPARSYELNSCSELYKQAYKVKHTVENYTPIEWNGAAQLAKSKTHDGSSFDIPTINAVINTRPLIENLDISFITLLGIWFRHGITDSDTRIIRISAASGDHVISNFIDLAHKYASVPKLEPKVSPFQNVQYWAFENVPLARMIHAAILADPPRSIGERHRLPNLVWSLNATQIQAFIAGLLGGRASYDINQDGQLTAQQAHQMADDLQRLALHAGQFAIIKNVEPTVPAHLVQGLARTTNPALKVFFYSEDQDCSSSIAAIRGPKSIAVGRPAARIAHLGARYARQEQWLAYEGPIYCLEVPDHVMYYRETFTSPPCWIGNSSRHGQKGVPAASFNQADILFSEGGRIPDKVLSPFCIPSRMTIGQLIEGNISKICAAQGTHEDATIFKQTDMRAIGDSLEELGFDRNGRERVYNGMTGEYIDMEIWLAPVFYQRLMKFVSDEVYSISTGPTDIMTRQPLEGKAKNGGLRIGEMERDVLLSHAAILFIMEKLRDDSDGFDIYVCRTCGRMPAVNENENIIRCPTCDEAGVDPDVVKVRSTWSSKLFMQELESAGVGIIQQIEAYEY
jgi:DNA-directed RNA polymerase beta subunit